MRLGVADRSMIHSIGDDESANMQIVNPVPVFLILGGFHPRCVPKAGSDNELRHAIAEAHRLQDRLRGTLVRRQRRLSCFCGSLRRGDRGNAQQQRQRGARESHVLKDILSPMCTVDCEKSPKKICIWSIRGFRRKYSAGSPYSGGRDGDRLSKHWIETEKKCAIGR